MDQVASVIEAVVIGGGAAGFFAAITCAEANPGRRVIIIEKTSRVLSKVRISGGGRCNVTHACFDPSDLVRQYPRGGKALRGPFSRFQPLDTMAWFEAHGVALKTERDGRVFPVTDRSETVIECLVDAARRGGVEIRTETSVQEITRSAGNADYGFEIRIKDAAPLQCRRVLLATGNGPHGWKWAHELGHTVEPPVPSLFTFTVPDARLQGLSGIAVDSVRLRLTESKLEQTGPLLITHWGLSGPAALRLSAWGARVLHDCGYNADLEVNWAPGMKAEELKRRFEHERTVHGKRVVVSQGLQELPKRLWARLAAAAGIREDLRWADASKNDLARLMEELQRGRYRITAKGVFKEEFVTCGGVRLDEVNFRTMESRICPGLLFAGEILDIDGITGGYNFQSAWTTGYLAGMAMAEID